MTPEREQRSERAVQELAPALVVAKGLRHGGSAGATWWPRLPEAYREPSGASIEAEHPPGRRLAAIRPEPPSI